MGHILCHDITQIIKDTKKDVVFKKGHIIREEDIDVLLSVGKRHLYVWENQPGMVHENDAAEVLYNMCKDKHMTGTPVKEGKIDLIALNDGLLKVDTKRLEAINCLGEIIIATRHGNFPIKKGDKIAGTRIIPLTIDEKKLKEAQNIAGDTPLLSILPYTHKKVGIITTGSEVYNGLIKDAFGPVIREKLSHFDVEVLGQKIVDDCQDSIVAALKEFIDMGADFICCTGGMSVDPDDVTPSAIGALGAEIVSYGAPVLPGAMFLLAYYNKTIPIVGLPGCVMYSKRTVFDLILPRLMADDKLTATDIGKMGHGGLCLCCDVCTFPNCGFGKGM